MALNYKWDVNLSDNGYSATGYVVTDTSTPSTSLGASNIVDWNFVLTNGSATDTLAFSNSTLNYGNGLNINSAGNALVLPQDNAFASITFQNTSSNIYFGYPNTTASTPNLRIVIGNPSTNNGGSSLGRLYGSTTFATGPTDVPWELSPNMLTVIGIPFFFGLQRLKKKVASTTFIKISETVS